MSDTPKGQAAAAAAVVDLYRRHADAWTRVRGASTFVERPWIERFASLMPSGGGVLDIGCGNGEPIGRFLSERGLAVTGVDASLPLIEAARAGLPAQTWLAGDMRTLELGRRFDGLIAWHSFFHLSAEDQRSMFTVFQRHAGPGAVLMFTSGPAAGVALGEFEGEELHHASLDPQAYTDLLASTGFAVLDHVSNDPDTQGATVWLARSVEAGQRRRT
jgi:SAM-dependent methyltransferase